MTSVPIRRTGIGVRSLNSVLLLRSGGTSLFPSTYTLLRQPNYTPDDHLVTFNYTPEFGRCVKKDSYVFLTHYVQNRERESHKQSFIINHYTLYTPGYPLPPRIFRREIFKGGPKQVCQVCRRVEPQVAKEEVFAIRCVVLHDASCAVAP